MKHETEPTSAGSAYRTGIRVGRAAGKSQPKQGSKKRSATKSRDAKPRAKRGTGAARAKASPRAKAAPRGASAATTKRRVTTPVPPAFAAQRASATSREHLLFELQRARASVKAAIQGLVPGSTMRPIAPGKWSPFEIVLHLSERDRVRLEEFGRTLAGQPHSWAGMHDPAMAPVNEAHLAPLRAHTWEGAVRRLDSMREQLLLRLAEMPALPDDVWQRQHTFGAMMWGLPEHDRHHAEQIKLARIGGPSPVEVHDV